MTLLVKKLITMAIKLPIENQNTKNPTVKISIIRKIPAAINHICHIRIPPFKLDTSFTNTLYNKNEKFGIDFPKIVVKLGKK